MLFCLRDCTIINTNWKQIFLCVKYFDCTILFMTATFVAIVLFLTNSLWMLLGSNKPRKKYTEYFSLLHYLFGRYGNGFVNLNWICRLYNKTFVHFKFFIVYFDWRTWVCGIQSRASAIESVVLWSILLVVVWLFCIRNIFIVLLFLLFQFFAVDWWMKVKFLFIYI